MLRAIAGVSAVASFACTGAGQAEPPSDSSADITAPPDSAPIDSAGESPSLDTPEPPDNGQPDIQVDSEIPVADAPPRVDGDESDGALGDTIQDADASPTPTPGAPCQGAWSAPELAGNLPAGLLAELSGLAASRRNPGVLWAHDDSGGASTLVALNRSAEVLGELKLPALENVDWEDVAAARCPDGERWCVWVADIGDNALKRKSVSIHAVVEPLIDTSITDQSPQPEQIWSFIFTYEGGAVDAEALFMREDGKSLWVIEKLDSPQARVFGHDGPLDSKNTTILKPFVTLPSPGAPLSKGRMVTGADLHPTGTHLAVRVYTGSFEYRLPQPFDIPALATTPATLISWGPFTEIQGEAIAYDPQENTIYTSPEDPNGSGGQPLHRYRCEE